MTDWFPLWLSLRVSAIATLLAVVFGVALAYLLAKWQSRWTSVVEAVFTLPIVLPPTVLGFYLLIMLGPRGAIGGTLESMGLHHLAFTFEGILIGSVLYSMPFAVQPLGQAFSNLGRRPTEVAASLGAGALDRFVSVVLPMTKGGFIVAMTLTFAHTMGEFGVILMVGGNMPGVTHVLSTTIYGYTEAMQYAAAGKLSLMLLIFAFVVLFVVYWFNRGFEMVRS